MKILADEWPKALLNCVLLSAILLYVSLPFWGFATWHRVLPEHDHVLVSADHAQGTTDDTTWSASSSQLIYCVDCSSSQPSLTVMHLPNAVGMLSFFALVIGAVFSLAILLIPSFVERIPEFVLSILSFILSPVDPPPTAVR